MRLLGLLTAKKVVALATVGVVVVLLLANGDTLFSSGPLNGQGRRIMAAADLPREPFRLTYVRLAEVKGVTDAGLANFAGCKHLAELHLFRMREYTDLAFAGEVAKARVIHDSLDPVREAFKRTRPPEKFHAHSKYWQELLGQAGGAVRPPLLELTDAEKEATRRAFRAGELGLDRYGLRPVLAELGVRYVPAEEWDA